MREKMLNVAVRTQLAGMATYGRLRGLMTRREGQGMIEYGLIIALIAIVAVVALVTLGGKVKSTFNNISSNLG